MTDLNVNVIIVDMPCSIRGFTRKNAENCTIFLNSRLNREQNLKTYKHELDHILKNHLDMEINVQEIELIAHGLQDG